ncbi:hypothetical protein [Nostoc sp. FACHB-280]|uniref:hypothetical protein n=1 Tax=Nostoc sp. FACHB-280 TaxID=2692839 RepID=UPI00168B3B45|nr:hypothetical protein [Nostoc sp. FACHB-280]MBD2495001.1 hypothetical protein [Nostoc sp. FACHB-280]
MVKNVKNTARDRVVSLIRHAALELSTLANEVEQLEELDKAAKSLNKFPAILDLIKKACWELQNNAVDKVLDLLSKATDESAQAMLDAE